MPMVCPMVLGMASTSMQEPPRLLLTALADEPRHGYDLIKEVAEGAVKLGTGTLYAALARLQQQGWVEATGEEVIDGRHRRYYALTRAGADALAEETERLRAAVREADRRLQLRLGGAGGVTA